MAVQTTLVFSTSVTFTAIPEVTTYAYAPIVTYTEASVAQLRDLIDLDVQYFINLYIMGVATTLVGVFGVASNVVSFVVFIRLGVRDSISVCLLSLTVADFGVVLMALAYSLCFYAKTLNPRLALDPEAVQYHLSWVRAMCFDLSMAITAFISVERCLCVVMPFTFKNAFSLTRAVVALIVIHAFTIGSYMPIFLSQGLAWRFDRVQNMSRVALWLAPNRQEVEMYSNIFTHVIVTTTAQVTVAISTQVMVIGLRRSTEFQKINSSAFNTDLSVKRSPFGDTSLTDARAMRGNGSLKHTPRGAPPIAKGVPLNPGSSLKGRPIRRQPALSGKNKSVAKMVSVLAAIFLVCHSCRLAFVYARRINPSLSPNTYLQNTYTTCVSLFAFVVTLNCSVSIFVYYHLRPSFKTVLLKTFLPCTNNGRGM